MLAVSDRKKAFTLIELLVVVAIIALLISILLPSLSQAREQGKKAVCMSNLKSIAQASHAYSSDDQREQLIPIHRSAVRNTSGAGFSNDPDGVSWAGRTAEPFAFGGRTATAQFPSGGGATMVSDTGIWAAHTRPLNRYVYGDLDQADAKKLEMYHCPSDTGYPKNAQWIQDCPQEACEIPLYNMLGNCYRVNTCGLVWLPNNGSFSVAAEGHTSSSIEGPSRVVLYSEPLFYNFSRQEVSDDPTLVPIEGWHKRIMSDNVAFCDGSGRMTRVEQLAKFDQPTLRGMNYTTSFGWHYFLRRGRTWQTDSYPSPGALIAKFDDNGNRVTPVPNYAGWPFDSYQSNSTP